MTPIDVRIRYKFETGFAPTYGISYVQKGCNYRGGLTTEYAEWLEQGLSKIINTQKRDYYFKDTGLHGIYYDKDRNIRYTKAYKEWLEERICQAYTVLEKLKK